MNDHHRIQAMTEGGHKLAEVRDYLISQIEPGMKLISIDQLAEKLLLATGGEPAFKKVPKYHWATCLNVNQGIVHGIPNQYQIQPGDLVSLDIGLYYEGYYTDTSTSVAVPPVKPQTKHFLKAGKNALKSAINKAILGHRIGHISSEIQHKIESSGYHIVPELTGHGVGKELHERPYIPGVLETNLNQTPELKLNQTIAIEVIYTLGEPDIIIESDGWTISTQDDKISGLFEETVIVTKKGPVILTK